MLVYTNLKFSCALLMFDFTFCLDLFLVSESSLLLIFFFNLWYRVILFLCVDVFSLFSCSVDFLQPWTSLCFLVPFPVSCALWAFNKQLRVMVLLHHRSRAGLTGLSISNWSGLICVKSLMARHFLEY